MALRMRHWLMMAFAGLGVISVLNLPPESGRGRDVPAPPPQEFRAIELRRDARRTLTVIQRMRWADSLSALTLAGAVDGLAVGGDPALIGPDELTIVRDRLSRELEGLPARRDDVVIGYWVQPPDFAAEPGLPTRAGGSTETYMGSANGTTYCLRVFTTRGRVDLLDEEFREWRESDGRQRTNLLRACRFAAAYGAPGARVERWLKRGATRFAHGSSGPSRLEIERKVNPRSSVPIFRSVMWNGDAMGVNRCRTGDVDACADVLLDPASHVRDLHDVQFAIDRSPATGISYIPRTPSVFGTPSDYLLGDLERDFGPVRFGAFWTSTADVETAFRDAFDTPAGSWTAAWVGEHLGSAEAGPGLPRSAAIGTVLTLLLAGLVGGGWSLRRRVA